MNTAAAVITVSDKAACGQREDTSGPALCALLRAQGFQIVYTAIVPDEPEQIKGQLVHCADGRGIPLVLTTGGTGFSPRDVTPEATRAVVEREAPGIPEAMRAESMKITPRGCLSRGVAGIRGGSLIINLPGSEKAARENLLAVLPALQHGLDMLASAGSAGCGADLSPRPQAPSSDDWLKEAKNAPDAAKCGMYLFHNGVVRQTSRAEARLGRPSAAVRGLRLSCDQRRVDAAAAAARQLPGVYYVRVWINEGELAVGDDMMLVLVGGDIRPHVAAGLETLVERLKSQCVTETEIF